MNYTIEGGTLPTLILNLEAGETIMTEGGAMSWMSPNMRMETTTNGGFGKMMGRMFSGEKLFMNRYTAQGGPGMIAMASSLPGSIKPFEIVPGRELICQKSAFLSCTDRPQRLLKSPPSGRASPVSIACAEVILDL